MERNPASSPASRRDFEIGFDALSLGCRHRRAQTSPQARHAGSKARAVVASLKMIDADPAADAAALERVALWALRQYSPFVAIEGTDGIVMDTGGADHLQGGEGLNGLRGRGLTARAAVAHTGALRMRSTG